MKARCHFTVKKHFLLEANEKQPEGLSPKSNLKSLLWLARSLPQQQQTGLLHIPACTSEQHRKEKEAELCLKGREALFWEVLPGTLQFAFTPGFAHYLLAAAAPRTAGRQPHAAWPKQSDDFSAALAFVPASARFLGGQVRLFTAETKTRLTFICWFVHLGGVFTTNEVRFLRTGKL